MCRVGWLVVAGALLAGCGDAGGAGAGGGDAARLQAPRGEPSAPASAFAVTVERVVDGDTFVAGRGGRRLRVRLIGVDAPESVRPGAPVECFGHESARVLAGLLHRGTRLSAAYQGAQHEDRYGRQLWDVWLPDGRFLQAELVREGAARPRAYPPQTRYADLLDRVGEQARVAGAGLYGACGPQ